MPTVTRPTPRSGSPWPSELPAPSRRADPIQNDLFDVGADLCTPVVPDRYRPLRVDPSTSSASRPGATSSTSEVGKLDSFILPADPRRRLLHQAPTLARRAERSAWALPRPIPSTPTKQAMLYLNRLSDLLFILARVANPDGDVLWKPGGER